MGVRGVSNAFSLREAQEWLQERVETGASCPCCGQFAKIYDRTINSGMARSLIAMYRVAPDGGWVHLPTQIGARSREEGKLRYWDLVEEKTDLRTDGGRAGYWRLTEMGVAFVKGVIKVEKYARVFDGKLLRLTGPMIGIREALTDKFDYEELMRG